MIYSVWNQKKQLFDYYNTDVEQSKANAPKPSIPHRKLGATISQASWKLPAGARLAGSGAHAKGRVAVSGVSFAPVSGLLIVGIVAAAYLYLRK